MRRHIPNLLTLLNLFCGCCASVLMLSTDAQVPLAFLLMGIALLADLLDGMTARLLGISSELGQQLDSLADLISFGFFPATLFYRLLAETLAAHPGWVVEATPAFILTLFAALRLGRFNIDPGQKEHFIGLPTPAMTIFALGFLPEGASFLTPFRETPLFIYGCIIGLSLLMVSPISLLSLKVKDWKWKGNEARILLLIGSLSAFLLFQWAALPVIIIFYVILSLLINSRGAG